jgi:cyclic-di-GMP phosphodiesterase TipF (flagellum assembly factor)
VGLSFQKSLQETGEKMGEITGMIDARTNENNRKIVSELQMLESLMREFAARISNKAKEIHAPPQRAALAAPKHPAFNALGDSRMLEMIRTSRAQNRVDL